MLRLLVIADDFTGALDTGVQFPTKEQRLWLRQTVIQILMKLIKVLKP